MRLLNSLGKVSRGNVGACHFLGSVEAFREALQELCMLPGAVHEALSSGHASVRIFRECFTDSPGCLNENTQYPEQGRLQWNMDRTLDSPHLIFVQ